MSLRRGAKILRNMIQNHTETAFWRADVSNCSSGQRLGTFCVCKEFYWDWDWKRNFNSRLKIYNAERAAGRFDRRAFANVFFLLTCILFTSFGNTLREFLRTMHFHFPICHCILQAPSVKGKLKQCCTTGTWIERLDTPGFNMWGMERDDHSYVQRLSFSMQLQSAVKFCLCSTDKPGFTTVRIWSACNSSHSNVPFVGLAESL